MIIFKNSVRLSADLNFKNERRYPQSSYKKCMVSFNIILNNFAKFLNTDCVAHFFLLALLSCGGNSTCHLYIFRKWTFGLGRVLSTHKLLRASLTYAVCRWWLGGALFWDIHKCWHTVQQARVGSTSVWDQKFSIFARWEVLELLAVHLQQECNYQDILDPLYCAK